MRMKNFNTFLSLLLITVLLISCAPKAKTEQQIVIDFSNKYDPKIDPANFSTNINNKYLTFVPGKKMVYQGETEEGTEVIEVYVTHETKEVMGVKALVVQDKVWLNGDLIEDTEDWYAQDNDGNVWYFGEDTADLVDGKIVSREGSWEAGVDGAKPGIVMKANPKIGDSYRQEYYKGKAEDKADVISLGESVKVPFGSFNNCMKTLDYTPLEPSVKENKYYCSEVGGVALEVDLESGERVELVSVEYGVSLNVEVKKTAELKTKITEEEAKEIALREVPGRVTDVAIEKKLEKTAYVVEVDTSDGETDVIIDVNTGEVLGIER